MKNKMIKRVKKMELNNPVITALIGLVIFYIGLKMFSGGVTGRNRIFQFHVQRLVFLLTPPPLVIL